LFREFRHSEEVKVTPLKHDVLNKLNREINNFRGAEILVLAQAVKL
jgi:hypothetical protein